MNVMISNRKSELSHSKIILLWLIIYIQLPQLAPNPEPAVTKGSQSGKSIGLLHGMFHPHHKV